MSHRLDRRDFLARSAAGGFFAWQASRLRAQSPNDKLRIAAIGVANKGRHNIDQLTREEIVALCDVDERFLRQAAESFPKARLYRDYRQMLEAEQNRVDAVVVSTADHTHAPATSMALDLGKHVYCEKPLTHTVAEARAVAQLAKRRNVATQMGTQIHAENNYRRVVELVQGGAIGTVQEVFCWCNKGWSDGRFQQTDQPAPSYLDWDLWLGPARERPYSPNIHPANWRRFWEYGSGTFGDMACHVMDLPFWALGLRHPQSVECEGPEVHPDGAPSWVKATYEFPVADRTLKLHWSDGGAHFEAVESTRDRNGRPLSSWGLGILFVGERGKLVADYGQRQLLPAEEFEDFQAPPETIPASVGHWQEWVNACKTGSPTTCNFDYSGALTEAVLLGTVAYRTGTRIQWNAERLEATNTDRAAEFITKRYRKGFEVVGVPA